MDFSSFLHRLQEVEQSPSRFYIVDPDLPLSVYFGLDAGGRPTLLIEDIGKSFSQSELPSTSKILIVSYTVEGKATLSFSLLDPTFQDVFNTLCFDLLESTRKESVDQALLSLLERFSEWQNLLKGTRIDLLTPQEQQGLATELLALKYFSERMAFEEALDAWVGPFQMDKDFEFNQSWAEIKSCKVSATSVKISSVEQLDSTIDGELFVYHVDRSPENKDGAFSLEDIVIQTRSLAKNAASRTKLDQKLLLAHYIDDEPEYQKRRFQIHSRDLYKVTKDFPCLRRETLISAITSCQYTISLPSIEKYKEQL